MNDLLLKLGVSSWKPVFGMLLLPPVPFLVLVLLGALVLTRSRILGWLLLLLGCAGIYLAHTTAAGYLLRHWVIADVPVLTQADIQTLRRSPHTAVLVLGGGSTGVKQEYGTHDLHARSIERLRYGIHLARITGLPLAFSGGAGREPQGQPAEAVLAARIAESEFGFKLRWQETRSNDTRENASYSVRLLSGQGIRHIVLVTHDFHMPRAARAFRDSIATSGTTMQLTLAPMGVPADVKLRAIDWLPSHGGVADTRVVIHEWLGRMLGA